MVFVLPSLALSGPPTDCRFGGSTFMCFKDLTLVPIQTKMIDLNLITQQDEAWLDNYHTQVRATEQDRPMMQRIGLGWADRRAGCMHRSKWHLGANT